MKAEDIVTIDLHGKSSIGDYMVVSSGRSNRHVASIADRVIEDLGRVGIKARIEGLPHADWVLIDAGDVIVHVFRPEIRTFYTWRRCGCQAVANGALANYHADRVTDLDLRLRL